MGRHSLPSRIARAMNRKRKTRGVGSGRPQSSHPRCQCGVMTLARAQARGKELGHDPSCPFYKERAIIV